MVFFVVWQTLAGLRPVNTKKKKKIKKIFFSFFYFLLLTNLGRCAIMAARPRLWRAKFLLYQTQRNLSREKLYKKARKNFPKMPVDKRVKV